MTIEELLECKDKTILEHWEQLTETELETICKPFLSVTRPQKLTKKDKPIVFGQKQEVKKTLAEVKVLLQNMKKK